MNASFARCLAMADSIPPTELSTGMGYELSRAVVCFGDTGRDWPTLGVTTIPAPNGRFGVGQEALKTRKPQATSFGPTEALDLAVDVRLNPAGCFRAGDDRLVAGVLGQQVRKTLLERAGQSVTDLTKRARYCLPADCCDSRSPHRPPAAAV